MLQILCDLVDMVHEMNVQLALHVHGSTSAPNTASFFSEKTEKVKKMADLLKLIIQ